jgi:serine/threonine protein kinase
LHRVVAIKVLAPALASSGAARQRFVREARAAAAVTHDNVIDIHAVEDDGAVPYLVMQFIDGRTLQEKLDRGGPLPLKEVLRIGLQVAAGLAAAHAQGLVHRDVKPANILLENSVERVKITDFGLARTVDDASLTQSGFIAGTPAYMSPEQADGDKVDHRSDLFSLGSVLYTLCAGHPPFRAGGGELGPDRVRVGSGHQWLSVGTGERPLDREGRGKGCRAAVAGEWRTGRGTPLPHDGDSREGRVQPAPGPRRRSVPLERVPPHFELPPELADRSRPVM